MLITSQLLKSRKEIKADLQLSVSKAKVFDECKLKYHYQYIKKLPKKERDYHILGKFVHEILENFQQTLIDFPDTDPTLLMGRCYKWSAYKWGDKIKKETLTVKKEKTTIHKEAKKICQDYLNKIIYSTSKVTDLEKPFYLAIDGRILIIGYIDLIQIDEDGVLHVADYKTSKNKKYVKNDFFQLKTYALVMFLENPELEKIRLSYIMLRLNSEYITQEVTREDVLPVEKYFREKTDEIQEEKLWRPEPNFMCKFCDFLEHCSSGKNYLQSIGKLPDELASIGKVSW